MNETYEYLTPYQVMSRFCVSNLSAATQRSINEQLARAAEEATSGNVHQYLEPAGLDAFRIVTVL